MSAKFWQKGEVMDYTTSDADVANGDVINLSTRIGIAGDDIAKGETGPVYVEGVFEIAKATGAISLGAAVYFDKTNKNISTTSSGNTPAGYAFAAAAAADTTVLVKLLG